MELLIRNSSEGWVSLVHSMLRPQEEVKVYIRDDIYYERGPRIDDVETRIWEEIKLLKQSGVITIEEIPVRDVLIQEQEPAIPLGLSVEDMVGVKLETEKEET